MQARRAASIANEYNKAHPDQAADFTKLTGIDWKDVRAVRAWQRAHGLTGDGRIGASTLMVASRGIAEPRSDVTFTDAEAQQDAKAPAEEPMEQAVGGGERGLKDIETGDPLEGDTLAADGVGRGAEDVVGKNIGKEVITPEGMGDVAAEGEEHGMGKTVGVTIAARALLIPRIVTLVREGKWKEALAVIRRSIGGEERVEIVKAVVEKLAGELGPRALTWFERFAIGGAVYDIVQLGWEWFKLGMESIKEAHERGDRQSANSVFAWAYADTLMTGSHSNPGAITPAMIEARNTGIEMGLVARSEFPELPFILKDEYGSDDNARRAVEDGLLAKAGVDVRTHSGK